ncbi:MAG: 30S ribosome-binding factor RbfA [Chitinophagaceae bacterium]|nr:30S ribosome-binding factor RbfA [Chitinophagaceae bacterium]
MTEGKRQKQVAAEISKELNDIFLKLQLNMQGGGMVSISSVKMTPDLHEARIYLSFFRVENDEEALNKFKAHASEIRGELGRRMRHQLRIIPYLVFYKDDTLEHVFRIEKLLDDLKREDSTGEDS